MFSKNFYPTPPDVIKTMLAPYCRESESYRFNACLRRQGLDFQNKTILEPSAGKGDILEYIKTHSASYCKADAVYCIEKNTDLQAILREKDFDVIADDFLTFESPYSFDFIVMNPPFDQGAKHLLKAWDILHTGEIVCLLNAETYFNPFSKERQLLKTIVDQHGTIEHLGDCFSSAERKTDVDVILIRLSKESKNAFAFDDSDFETTQTPLDFPDDLEANKVAVLDILLAYEHRYTAAVEAFGELKKAINKFRFFTNDVFLPSYSISDFVAMAEKDNFNTFVKKFNTVCWNKILDESKFESFLTTNVRRSFSEKFSHQTKLAFTKANMLTLFEVLWQNKTDILESCIEDVFDIMTQYHHENRAHIEGWKTNDAWRVNRKVILPRYISYGSYCSAHDLKEYGSSFSLSYRSELTDIDRCMCYIEGRHLEHICTIEDALRNHFRHLGSVRTGDKFQNKIESTYFEIRFFKKGTLHITFKEEFLWREFNYRAAKYKGFPLPDKFTYRRHGMERQSKSKPTQTDLFPALI